MRRKSLAVAIVCGVLGLSLAACVPNVEESADVSEDQGITPIETAPAAMDSSMEELYGFLDNQAEKWAPKVITMEDGTQVQRTPDSGGDALYAGASSSYNTLYLDADNRGCESCHTNGLVDLVENHLSYPHWPLDYGLGTNIDVEECIACHDNIDSVTPVKSLGSLIHGIHKRESFKGDCMSCHTATSDGQEMELWEVAKYDELQGIGTVENVTGDFSFDQTTLGGSPVWTWWPSLESVESGDTAALQGAQPGDDAFKTWEINVSGSVKNPFSMTLEEIIAEAPSETFISSSQCVLNPNAGELVGNFEVTGVPISWFIEKAGGLTDNATSVSTVCSDGGSATSSLEDIAKEGGWLVYKINGEDLSNAAGYPVRAWLPEHGAPNSRRWITDLVFGNDEVHYYEGGGIGELPDAGGPWVDDPELGYKWVTKPNVAICHTYEGQIIPVGQPYEFEGYADAFNEQVVAMEFSMDGGETWTRFDTSTSDKKAWVYWHFTYTPEETGAYVLQVRAITDQGNVNPYPDKVMVNVK